MARTTTFSTPSIDSSPFAPTLRPLASLTESVVPPTSTCAVSWATACDVAPAIEIASGNPPVWTMVGFWPKPFTQVIQFASDAPGTPYPAVRSVSPIMSIPCRRFWSSVIRRSCCA